MCSSYRWFEPPNIGHFRKFFDVVPSMFLSLNIIEDLFPLHEHLCFKLLSYVCLNKMYSVLQSLYC